MLQRPLPDEGLKIGARGDSFEHLRPRSGKMFQRLESPRRVTVSGQRSPKSPSGEFLNRMNHMCSREAI